MKTKSQQFIQTVAEVIRSLNAQFGRGSVVKVGLGLDGAGWFDYVIPLTNYRATKPRRRTFRIHHNSKQVTVFALGHQKTINL